ncbi:MAG TPA: lipid-A-disaccharide synthase, partial [Alteromonas macleodii]|nr:lipid-A-disaccharide synthase [Alteromonas macleodii]
QEEVNAENMSNQLLNFFESDNSALISRFTDLHHTLKCNADKTAAKAVVEELFA